jgi:hypothetical protein
MSRFLRISGTIINPKWISYMTITPEVCKIRIAPIDIDGWWLAGSGSVRSEFHLLNITQKESSKTFTGIAKAMAEQWSQFIIKSNI